MLITAYRPLSEELPTFAAAKVTDFTQIISYRYQKFISSVGNFTLTLPTNVSGAELLEPDMMLSVDNVDFLVIRDIKTNHTEVTIEGYDLKELLARRITLFPTEEYEAGTYGSDVIAGSTEECIKHYVTYNAVESEDVNRNIYGLTVAPNLNRGRASDTYMSRLDVLSDVIGKLCDNAGIGFDIVMQFSHNRYLFDVFAPTDKTDSQSDNNRVIFAIDNKNIKSIERGIGNKNEKNAIYAVMGGDDVFVQAVSRDGTSAVGFARREVTVNVSCERDEIDDYALKSAEEMILTDSLEMEVGNVSEYGNVYTLGDKVTFIYNNLKVDSVLTEVVKDYSGNAMNITVIAGDKTPKPLDAVSGGAAVTKTDLKESIFNRRGESGIYNFEERLPTVEEYGEIPYDSLIVVHSKDDAVSGLPGMRAVTECYYKVEPVEEFNITINSGEDSSFMLPTSGRLNNTNNSYAWIVDWGDGTTSEHNGTGAPTSGITHTYPEANINYVIKIKPQNPEELGWLRAFGFNSTDAGGSNVPANKNKVALVSGQLSEEMIRVGPTDNYVCAYMFYGCTSLTMSDTFQLPQSITSVGSDFCAAMFLECTNLTMNSIFQLPQDIISVSSGFCRNMFAGCTNLTMNSIFQLPQGVTSVGNNFCGLMFANCTSLTMSDTFQLPQGITSVDSSFCREMFAGCSSITLGVIRFFGNLVLPDTQLNLSDVYIHTFNGCNNLTESLVDIPQLNEIPNSRRYTFKGAPTKLIAPLHTNWK